MKPLLTACLCLAAAAAGVPAQGMFDLPTQSFNPTRNNIPIGAQRMRYQQWYSAAEFQAFQQKPIRITGFAFRAAPNARGQTGQTIELEVTMANAQPFQTSGSFAGNMVSGRVVCLPRARINIGTATPGSYPVTVNFQNEFVWDGHSGVVLDLRIFDNGNNNVAYAYDLEFNPVTVNRLQRMYTINDPNAAFAAFGPQASGITTRFFYNEAIDVPYGQGCAGEGGHVPVATTVGGFPVPGNSSYEHQVQNAPSQRNAVFWIGLSDSAWGSRSLPLSLDFIGAPNCSVLAQPIDAVSVTTVGGGPGLGIGRVPFPLPSATFYLGTEFYSQWAVFDPNAANGILAMSNGVWTYPAAQ